MYVDAKPEAIHTTNSKSQVQMSGACVRANSLSPELLKSPPPSTLFLPLSYVILSALVLLVHRPARQLSPQPPRRHVRPRPQPFQLRRQPITMPPPSFDTCCLACLSTIRRFLPAN